MIRKHHFTLPLILATALTLSACGVDRDVADQRLAKGCAAGAELYIDEGYQIKEIQKVQAKADDSGIGDRKVQVTVIESDGWVTTDKQYVCIFTEKKGLLGGYSANLFQLNVNGQTFGKTADGNITGTFQDWTKLSETVDQVINQ